MLWHEPIGERPAMSYPALLLDRDGVVNVDRRQAVTHRDFRFMDGIFPLVRHAVDLGYRVAIITNQAGIAEGDFTEAEFLCFTEWMIAAFRAEGAPIAAVYCSPFHPDGRVAAYRRDSFWRKPAPGMILEAARELELDLRRSVFIGDRPTDIQAAAKAGVGRKILLGEGSDPVADLTVGHLSEVRGLLTGWRCCRRGSPR